MNLKKIIKAKITLFFVLSTIIMMTSCGLHAKRDFLHPHIHSPLRPTNLLFYIPNRVMDVLDVASVGVMVGPGLFLKIQATDIIKFVYPFPAGVIKLGWNTHYEDDLNPKNPFYLWKRYKPLAIGLEGRRSAMGLGFLEFGDLMRIKTSPDEVKVGIHFILVGADVGIRPVDILDLVTGFFFIDINDDDLRYDKKSKED